jgi:multimeric flavodoxin WrbA
MLFNYPIILEKECTQGVKMKILGISCSPHVEGNTVTLLKESLKGAQAEGAEAELYSVAGKTIQPCEGCGACFESGVCKIKDDMQELYGKMLAADGIIFGTPVYFWDMTAQAKAVIDRTFALNRPEKSLVNKVGGIVVVAGSLGIIDVLKELYFYMATRRMLPGNYVAAYPVPKGGLQEMEKCRKAAYDLGRQMVKIAALKFEYPADIARSAPAYGTHTR